MLGRLFRRDSAAGAIASALYGAIVAQARAPALYTDFGVPDTVTGRFEMVTLHVILMLDRLEREGEAGRPLGQAVFDLYVKDMDRSLRELGIGDLGVPKRMKKMAEAFYGRHDAYRQALAAGDRQRMAEAVARNVYPDGNRNAAAALADYSLASRHLPVDITTGAARFAELGTISPEAAA
ncbi:MAG TPA: ubiquinol-cytochrome C chaperone family protein [Bauldia sp.]|nr:ubiquinol-cytochrome C chaperone family protein [Bauldia sp.]